MVLLPQMPFSNMRRIISAIFKIISLSDFPSKEVMRDALLDERGWEFVAEGMRRMDLIRHGKLISGAISRGAENAKEYMTRYPIPLNEIEANPNLIQNTGY